ncbi:MAG TPA: hypothetical protein VNL98_12700 [Gemmatimonadales bacterium]|nr:hypothetical protein [Gemmatimonadales bacterium]
MATWSIAALSLASMLGVSVCLAQQSPQATACNVSDTSRSTIRLLGSEAFSRARAAAIAERGLQDRQSAPCFDIQWHAIPWDSGAELAPDRMLSKVIEVEGVRLQYNAYQLSNGVVNVGRINPVQ